jgi:uncharacterized protein
MNPLKWRKKPEPPESTAIRPELNPEPEHVGCSAYAAEVMAEEPEKVNPFLALDAAKGVIPANAGYAMDAAVIGFHDLQYSEPNLPYVKPLSYGTLSLLSLDSLIRKGVDALADAMTRNWIDIQHTGEDDPDKLKALTDALESFKVRKKFREAASKQGFFGGCFLFIDMGDDTDTPEGSAEVKTPLMIDKRKIRKGSFKGLQIVEPWVCAPFYKNTTNPLKNDYYEAELWFVMGKQVHRSRLLRFVQNEVSQQLKPAFFGFGISQAQLVLDYVEKFFTTRSSIVDLVDKFSVSILATDMKQLLSGTNSIAAAGSLKNRIDVFNSTRNNRRTMALDKDKEEYTQVNTPITGLADLLTKNLEFVAAAFAMPATELTGISPSGFQATGENEKRSWYDRVLSMQAKMFADPLRSVIEIIQLSEFGEIDSDITFKFKPLEEMSEAEIAENNSKKAATGSGLIMAGVITPEEERARLRDDPESGYSGLADEALPEVSNEQGGTSNALQELYGQIGITNDAAHWITVHGGKDGEGSSHVMLDGEGNVIAGAGGKLDGQKFSPKSKSDDVAQHSARPQQTVNKPKPKEKSPAITAHQEKKELLDTEHRITDVSLLGVGDYVAVTNKGGTVYAGFVQRKGSKNITVETNSDAYGVQELSFPIENVKGFYKPKQEKTAPPENSSLSDLQNSEKDVKLPSEGQESTTKSEGNKKMKSIVKKFDLSKLDHSVKARVQQETEDGKSMMMVGQYGDIFVETVVNGRAYGADLEDGKLSKEDFLAEHGRRNPDVVTAYNILSNLLEQEEAL